MCGKGEDPLDVVHVGDSLLRIRLRHISDEPEPSAPARVTVLDDNLDRLSGSAYDQGMHNPSPSSRYEFLLRRLRWVGATTVGH